MDSSINKRQAGGERIARVGMVMFLAGTLPFILLVLFFVMVLELGTDLDFLTGLESVFESDFFSAAIAVSAMVITVVQNIGLGLLLWALFIKKVRRPWFYLWMQVASVLMIFSAGSIVLAIVVSRYLYHQKHEFREVIEVPPPPIPAAATGLPAAVPGGTATGGDRERLEALEAENRSLRKIVADQALLVQKLRSADGEEV